MSDYSTPEKADKFTSWKTASKIVKYIEEPNVLKLIGDLNGKSVIEYGCGTGHYTRAVAARTDKVTGVDCAENMLRLAQSQSEDQHRIEYKLNDCTNLFDYGEYDVALSVYFLSCASSKETLKKFLTSMFHSLKAGGVCCGLTVSDKVNGYEQQMQYNVTTKRVRNEISKIDELHVSFFSEATNEKMIELKHYLIPHEVIEETFKEVGFGHFKWVKLELPKEYEQYKDYFDDYLHRDGTVMYHAVKL